MNIIAALLLGFVVFAFVGIYILLRKTSFFDKIQVEEKEIGPFSIVYKEKTGDYRTSYKTGMEVYEFLKTQNIENTTGIGIFFHDPSTTAKKNLKSHIGSIVSQNEISKIKTTEEFKIKKLEKQNCALVYFPIKNMMSFTFGPFKAYPAIKNYIKEKKLKSVPPAIEIYDIQNKKITFAMPIKSE